MANGNDPVQDVLKQFQRDTRSQLEQQRTAAINNLDQQAFNLRAEQEQARRQNVQDIRERRARSLRSGATSGELAAQELQSLVADQTAATQTASAIEQQRGLIDQAFGGTQDQRAAIARLQGANNATNLLGQAIVPQQAALLGSPLGLAQAVTGAGGSQQDALNAILSLINFNTDL